jgi:hypothetical protein
MIIVVRFDTGHCRLGAIIAIIAIIVCIFVHDLPAKAPGHGP